MSMNKLSRRAFVAGTGALGLMAAAGTAMAQEVEQFDAEYDVVVVGFGFAGCAAAVAAVDAGAQKVLIVDAAPKGHEGGNSRYCAQVAATAIEREGALEYYRILNGGMDTDDAVIETFVDGIFDMPSYFKRMGIEEPLVWSEYLANTPAAEVDGGILLLSSLGLPEYPELPGSQCCTATTAHIGVSDSAFYLAANETVMNTEQIEVWFESPAQHLIVDEDGTVLGVTVDNAGVETSVRATNGVVLACGGFECNTQMIQNYLGLPRAVPKGGLFNNGDGIRMAQEVGADLWHMGSYESFGICGNYVWEVPEGQRVPMTIYSFFTGPMMVVAEDGSRFADEGSLWSRHGKMYVHGLWEIVNSSHNAHMVCTEEYLAQAMQDPTIPAGFEEKIVSAETPEELAELIGANPEILSRAVRRFNAAIETGEDLECGRDVATMAPIEGTLFALPLLPSILNTQGGPRRNEKAQVINVNGEPVKNLFSAGECGGITAHYYQGGSNVSECMVFGTIAGTNAFVGVE